MANNGQSRGGKIKVQELSAKCLKVGLIPTGGWRATLAVNIELEGPDGQRYRGAGSRLHVRVYPIVERSAGRKKAGAASANGRRKRASAAK